MIKVINTDLGTEITYLSVSDFLEDVITDGMVEDYIDDIYGNVEIAGEKFPTGEALRKCISDDRWQLYKDDFQAIEYEYIEDELSSRGETDFWQWTIIDLDWTDE